MHSEIRTRQKLLTEFDERGFVVIPNALDREQIAVLNHAIDDDLSSHSRDWVRFDETLVETVDVLSRTEKFDFTIENPITLGFLRCLLGEDISFEEFEVILREPTDKPRDIKGWHRDMIRDYNRRMGIQYVSVMYYLTDVSETDHCFSIIPETHNRLVDLKPEEVVPGSEFDVVGPAGTAIIFHGRCIHTGKLKPQSRQRRTLHIYYWRANRPRTSEWTEIPKRLYEKSEPTLPPLLYSKWNVTEVIEGVGKKPRDVDSSTSVADMLREVQRRANRTVQTS